MIGLQYARARGSGARAYIENLHTDRGYRVPEHLRGGSAEASRERTSGSRISVQKNFYTEQVWLTHEYYTL